MFQKSTNECASVSFNHMCFPSIKILLYFDTLTNITIHPQGAIWSRSWVTMLDIKMQEISEIAFVYDAEFTTRGHKRLGAVSKYLS